MGIRISSFSDAIFVAVSGVLSVFVMLACLAMVIWLMAKASSINKAAQGDAEDHPLTALQQKPVLNGAGLPQSEPAIEAWYGGEISLYDTEEKTAACLMAIVSYEMGIPLNELQWKSIRNMEGRKL